ncbi:Na+/H+ antiporter NhaA [Marinobacterium arenosum]|uniref:Na+/H+ antiporter NhaA n=1 Tax=Marinobacterium arenosum TaxID=2862496 RepID=UPI001C94BF16|nr:Na+/H+ antiporter NhaA [Marinobacterium arenosum]MBY4676086.1 Na+/H+ antiporter NhaA [Marinobacterium arenosum]
MKALQAFIRLESASGILLIAAMVLAMLMANTPLTGIYDWVLRLPVEVRVGPLELAKPLLLWINDGLMAIFFLLVGLEVKREALVGQLSDRSKMALPAIAALGGMLVPALVFYLFNAGDPTTLRGWAIPTATDIAFALGVLSLLGNRVPAAAKLFLMALAIMDDLGAIVIIAVFYTSDLSVASLVLAGICLVVLALMNRLGVVRIAAYVLVGVVLWISVLKSGVHATLAGVALAFAIPMKIKGSDFSPLKWLEHQLHAWVAFFILPLFAFANAGVSLAGMSLSQLLLPVPMGIMAGLFFGKQIGVFLFSYLAVKLRLASLPDQVNWRVLYGVSLLTGVGFTMSLFIDSLAYEGMGDLFGGADRLAILLGSMLSAVAGYLMLRLCKAPVTEAVEQRPLG